MKKLLLTIAALLGFVSPSIGQGIRYQSEVQSTGGFPNPTIRVCVEPATGTPCTPLASIFSDAALTNPLANPFSGDSNGNYYYYANPSSTYHIQISGNGLTTYDIPDVTLPGGGTVIGGGTTVLINASPVAAPSANFNSTQPAIPLNNLGITFQKDANGVVTGISAYVPYASPTQIGVVQLANDFGGIAALPTVVQTHLASPLPILQGGCNSTTKAGCFNNIAPSTQAGGLIVGTGPDTYGNLPAPSIGTTCLTDITGSISWVTCGSGTVTGSGTANKLTKFTAPTVVGDSGITDTGTLVSTAELVQLTNAIGIGATSVPGGSSSLPANGTTITSLADIESVITGAGVATPVHNNLVLSQDLNYSSNWQVSDAPLKIWQQTDSLNAASLTGGGFMRGAQITATHAGSGSVSIRGLSSSAFAIASGAVPENDAIVAFAQENGPGLVTANNAILAQSGLLGGNGNITTDATVNIASPAISGSGTMATHYGLFIGDQSVGGSKNPIAYSIFSAGGQMFHSGAVGIGALSVPGACGVTASCSSVLDVEKTADGSGTAASNTTVFQHLDINLAADSTKVFSSSSYSTTVNAANSHNFNGAFGSGPKGFIVGLDYGGSGSITAQGIGRGLDVETGTNSTFTGSINTLTGIYAPLSTQGVGALTNARGIWVNSVPQSGTTTNDVNLYVGIPGVTSGSTATLTHHYGVYIENQAGTTGGIVNSDPWGIFEANATENNQFGNLIVQGALSSPSTGSVNFASSLHTLNARAGTVLGLPATCTFTAGAAMEVYLATNATAGQNWYFCTGTNVWTQQLNSGGGGAMSTSASNAAAVAVPNGVDWKPATAGGAALGTTANPWSQVVVGNGSGTSAISGTFTGNRTATLPDANISIAGFNLAQTWTATQTFAAILASSVSSTTANPAAAGFERLANTDCINFRNGTNAGDISGLCADANNFVYLGQSGSAGVRFPTAINSLTSGLAMTIQPTANTGNGTGGILSLIGGAGAGTGGNGDVIVSTSTVGSGAVAVIQLLAPVTFPITNNSPTGTTINRLASYDTNGRAIITPAGSLNGVIGVCAENCTTTGSSLIAKIGKINLNLDNTGIPGHAVGISTTTAGFGTDCGGATCSTQFVGVVTAAVSGTVYTVDLSVGGGGSVTGNVIVNNPATAQIIQSTSSGIVPLAVQCPAGAAGTLDCFEVKDNTGNNVFRARQDGSVIWGSGTTGTVTAQALISPTVPSATVGEVRLGNTDIGDCWRNNANNLDLCFSKDTQDVVHLNAILDVTSLTTTGSSLSLTEAAAVAAVSTKDILYADSTFHLPFFKNNNGAAFAIDYVSQVNTQAGTTYTVLASDISKIVNFTNGGAITVTIPQATGQFANHACFTVNAFGAGTATLTPTTSTINGGATLAIASGKSAKVCADGSGNYLALVSITSAGAGDMIKNATNTMGASGTIDLSGSSVTAGLRLPNGAGASPTVLGNVAADSTTNLPVFGNGTGTITLGGAIPNVQTGTTYTILTGDRAKLLTVSNAGAIAITLPQASASFPNGWYIWVENTGVGAATVTPTTSTIDGIASITLTTNQGVMIASNGTNYFTANRGQSSGLSDCALNGFLARTSANATTCYTLTGTANQITITHGVGDGTPVWSLDTTHVALDTNALTFTNKNIDGSTNTLTNIGTASLSNNAVTSAKQAVVNTRRQCDITIGDTSAAAVTNAQLGPQKRICQIPYAATVVQITVSSDAGTPNVIVGRSRCTTFVAGACTVETRVNLLSSALATATGGFEACSNTGGTTGLDGGTTCSATLQNTGINIGDSIELVSGTAGGTAKLVTAHITYTVN